MKEKFKVIDADLRPLEDFPLKWRWTDAKWDRLPPEATTQIISLTESKAAELFEFQKQFNNSINTSKEILDTSSAEIQTVEDWLTTRIGGENYVFVSWNQNWAVRTTAEIFCRYWNTFCYPSSDDVTVSANNLNWILFYHHDEKFSLETPRK